MYSTDVFLFSVMYSHPLCLHKFYAFVPCYLKPDGHLSSQTEIDYPLVVELFPVHFPFFLLMSKDRTGTGNYDLFSSVSEQIVVI